MNRKNQIGYIVGGGLKENLRIRLTVPSQEVQEGAFVVIRSGDWMFYGLVTDIYLGATDPRFADEQSELRLPHDLARMLHGQTLYTNLEVLPALMQECGQDPDINYQEYNRWVEQIDTGLREHPYPLPVKTIPPHHAEVFLADAGDIAEIFGEPDVKGNYVIGYTREQSHPVCVNLEKFVQRSSGIFGATGTGKSFLTRIILAGLIKLNQASVLVLDMHNEYAYDDIASDSKQRVIGLRNKFTARVRVIGLGKGARIRNQTPDYNLEIAERDITPEDIELLTRELNLKETTPATLDAMVSSFGHDKWFSEFRKMKSIGKVKDEDGNEYYPPDSIAGWAISSGANIAAAEGLHIKLGRIFHRQYIVENPAADTVGEIIKSLEEGPHVILSFGRFENDLDYLLVSNLLTRRIRQAWEKRTNHFRTKNENEPRPLVVVVEEAHKLLNREMAAQTTFSTIAREMRKYYVTLLIVDQRPSQIYDEVMSQLGTRISGWLGDTDDIRSVLSGLAGRDALRGMLARLQPKEEVLLLGWGVPMPLPVRSRRYDDRFWEDLTGKSKSSIGRSEEDVLKELGF